MRCAGRRSAVAARGRRRRPRPRLAGCPCFPADNPWNQRVDRLPVAADSARLIARIGLGAPVHPDFGTVYDGAPNGIPFTVVSDQTRRVPVSFEYASESDRGTATRCRAACRSRAARTPPATAT